MVAEKNTNTVADNLDIFRGIHINMGIINTDILVIGGGSGGLSVAAGASQMGAQVVLCESKKMGGDCLNTGCVPSKALIASARAMQATRQANQLGIPTPTPAPDFNAIHDHIQAAIDSIAPHDSVDRFESLGVRVIQASASFIDKHTIKAGQYHINAKYIVIATGSTPSIPPIPGLDKVPYLTNETIFDLSSSPDTLAVIGGGPIGCEIAQAYALLGCKVILLEAANEILSPVDDQAREILKLTLQKNGVEILAACQISDITHAQNKYHINTNTGRHKADLLMVATGRKPTLSSLHLENTDIVHTPKGISIDKRMRTTQKRIFAIGDVASPVQFTHAAGYQASIVIRNILFKLPAKVDYRAFPWVVYTTPEIAHVGLSMAGATTQGAKILKYDFKDNDRAIAEKETQGFIKVAIGKKGKILGVTIVASHAGELLTPWTLAIQNKLNIKQMAGFIVPYPTLSEAHKRIAGSYFTPMLYSEKTKRLVRWLLRIK